MNTTYLGIRIYHTCTMCMSEEFCKECVIRKFRWNEAVNKTQQMATGIPTEDAAKLEEALSEQVATQILALMSGEYNIQMEEQFTPEEAWEGTVNPRIEGIEDDTWTKLSRKINNDEELTINEQYSYDLAVKRSMRDTNYEIDEDRDYIYVRIEDRFRASNRSYPTARDGTRFKCPTCNKEELGVMDIKKIGRYLKISGSSKMQDTQLYSIPEVRTEVLRRMREQDYDGYVDVQNPISADEAGYCPICGAQIRSNAMHTKGTKRRVKAKERFVPGKSYRTAVLVNEDEELDLDDKTKIGQFTWINIDDMNKRNFIGHANKKSDGRGLHEVSIGMKKHRHGVSMILAENINRISTTRIVIDGPVKKNIVKITRGEACECGCPTKLHDTRRDEIVCPECGIVYGRGVPEGV